MNPDRAQLALLAAASPWRRSDLRPKLGIALLHGTAPRHSCLSTFGSGYVVTTPKGTTTCNRGDVAGMLTDAGLPIPTDDDLVWLRG